MRGNLKTTCLALVTLGVLGVSTMPALACKEITAVALQGSETANLIVRVNNVTLINHRGSHTNTVPANLLLEGGNDFEIELVTKDPNATGRAEVFVACEGEFPKEPGENEKVLTELQQKGSGILTSKFNAKAQPKFSYLSASPSSEDGLLEAIDLMRRAATSGHVDGYVSYLEPMIADLPLAGGPPPLMVEGMVRELLSGQYKISETHGFKIRKILNGRAYQVVNDQDQGPIQFEKTDQNDGGAFTLTQGAFWIKTSAGWKVFRP